MAEIPPQRIFRALADAAAVLDREVDLVDLDECPTLLRAVIDRDGRVP